MPDSSPHSRLRAAVMGTPAEAELNRLEEQLETLRLALHAIADEGQYMYAGEWHREAAVIAALALHEVSSPASDPVDGDFKPSDWYGEGPPPPDPASEPKEDA